MTVQEVTVPYVVEDFEQDDEVWRYNSNDKSIMFGSVYTTDENCVYVSGDDGNMHAVHISSFGSKSNTDEGWGKLLDASLIEEGTLLSLRRWKFREFWKVTYFRNYRTGKPGKIHLFQDLGAFSKSKEYEFENRYALQKLLFAFDIEG